MKVGRASTSVASAALLGLAGLHAVWGLGATWPLPDRASLADAVVGTDDVPPPAACFAVAGALGVGAILVGSRPSRVSRVRRWGSAGVVGVLAARGVAGLLGGTDRLSPGSTSPRFRRLDRRLYSPLCLGLAALSAPAAGR